MAYKNNSFPCDYIPTIEENYSEEISIGDKVYNLSIFDTSGSVEFDRLRPLTYPSTDVFLLCFSLVDHTSYESITLKWFDEVQHHCPDAKILLVGTKSDLIEDPSTIQKLREKNLDPITPQKGLELSNKINASKYLECSALTHQNLKNLFDQSIRSLIERKPVRRCGTGVGPRCDMF